MRTVESKTGKIKKSAGQIFGFLSDFRNFERFIPKDKVQDWSCTQDTCSFNVMGIGSAGLKITEKNPDSFIKISSDQQTPIKFQGWVDIQPVDDTTSNVRITLQPDVNPIMMSMIQSQLKSFADELITQLEKIV